MMENQKTISLLVKDHPGVMQRITSLFTRRGFNMESITVGAAEETGLSRILIVTTCNENLANQILNQLLKLIDVYEAIVLKSEESVMRELALLKINIEPSMVKEITDLVDELQATIVNISTTTLIIQAVGDTERINTIVTQFSPYGICRVSRTGMIAIEK
ncbi:acetolactate synthase small subunit [Metabacillus fastidiosus]|uniref:acetolactate synthase small subunit n=1 Tax=Metabacillus fastidiosus TaxID=1458 RepID=UPI002E1EA5D1|nr:acetolactate synthase small subunit [Metabacillus fastidiosus]MED4531468.1 acetolactate synthase small subunit [Metabacillus fastidiosus]